MDQQFQHIDRIIEENGSEKKNLIPLLQAIQNEYNYLPEEALQYLSEKTSITPSEIVSVASFYKQFRMKPAGKHMVKICVGTACHVKGAGLVYDSFRRHFKLPSGTDTDDSGNYTLEKVSCLGCCTLAPVVQVDEVTYGHVAPDQVDKVIEDFESRRNNKGAGRFRKPDGTEIKGEIRIGLGSCCVASGSGEIEKEVESVISQNHLRVKLKHVGCVGMCHQVPLVEIVPNEGEPTLYAKVKPEDVRNIVESHFQPPGVFSRLKNKIFSLAEDMDVRPGRELGRA